MRTDSLSWWAPIRGIKGRGEERNVGVGGVSEDDMGTGRGRMELY
jgi:hypothetical protein